MRMAQVTGPALAFLVKDFRTALLSPKLGIVSSVVAAITLLAVWNLGTAAQVALGGGADPATLHLWERGANGVLAALAFLMPAFLPVLPVFVARQNLKADRDGGLLALALTKPVVSGSIGMGKLVGLMAALTVPVALISMAAVFLVQLMLGMPVDTPLVVTFLTNNLLLTALYLLLAFAAGRGRAPEYVGILSFLAWAAFNILRPTAFELLGQMIGALALGTVVSFEYALTDTLSFTGLYQGLLASSLPVNLGFVTGPVDIAPILPWSALVWMLGLAALNGYFLYRLPVR